MTDLATRTIEIAASQIGVTEHPPGSNTGPQVDQYLAAVHCPPPNPWCSALVCWAVQQAANNTGTTPELRFSASALQLFRKNPAYQFRTITPDDVPCIAVHDHGHNKGHTFFVVGLDESTGQLQTIEGNSDKAGSRTGGSVVALNHRTTTDAQLLGFLRIA